MATELRQTGINVVAEVPWGTHFCHFYETKQDLLDTLVPYFKAGLESKEFCLWLVSNSELITVEEAKGALEQAVPDLKRHLSDENIEILNGLDWYLEDNMFSLERVTSAWDAKLKQALARGYGGLRVSGDTLWLAEKDWKTFSAYEKQVNDSITDRPIKVLCTYPLAKSGAAEILDVVQNHQFAIARRQGEWNVIESPELIQAKSQIKRLNKELEQRVIEGTNELRVANEELSKKITDLKQIESELRESQQQFESLVHSIDGIVWEVNAETFRFTFVSKQAERILGYPVARWLEPNFWADHLHPDDREWAVDFCVDSTQRRVDHQFEYRMIAADARVVWLRDHVTVNVRMDESLRLRGVMFDISERKQAEALLHAKEQEFRAIVENAPDQIIRYDREFRRTYVNPAVAKAYGLPVEALIGTPIGSVIHDAGLDVKVDELAEIRQRIAAVFETGKSYEYEITWPIATGRRYYSVRLFPELDLHGSVINVLGIARDITERKQAEDALRRSEDRIRLIIDTIPTMAWSILPDGTVDFANQRWLDYAGEGGIDDPNRIVHPEDLPVAMEKWLAHKTAGKPSEDEMRLRRADGEYRWFLVRTAPLRDEQGNLVKWYGVSIDIEDRKRADEKLKQSECQLAEAQRLANVGSWNWDVQSNASTWSVELYSIYGVDPQAFSPGDEDVLREFIHVEDRALVRGAVESALKSQEPFSFYYRIHRADGEERVIHSRGDTVSDKHGNPIRMFGTAQDVTERKHAEEQLRSTSEQLRALSARLQSAREEEGTRIAREIHDELGSMLTSLKWDLEEIQKILSTPVDSAHLAAVREKLVALIKLTDMSVSALRRIASELRPSILDDLGLAAAIEWQAQQFQTRTGIVCVCDCLLDNVELSKEQSTAVFRILQEALTNVLRHANATRVDIRMNTENSHFLLSVSDNGKGITETEKSEQQSLGILGMRERAHLIGGKIDIKGVEEKGTVVTVRVPVSIDKVLEMNRPSSPVDAQAPAATNSSDVRHNEENPHY